MAHVADITIDHTLVSADLTDYVVYVNLADLPAAFWSTVANGGGDIRVYKSDGTTEIAREVVSCVQASDTGELHIKYAGTLSSSVDTTIQIHADGSSSEPAAGATYGKYAVWSDYKIVTHGAGDADSKQGVSPAVSGVTAGGIAGKMGNGTHFDGSSITDRISYGDYGDFGTDNTTVQCWVTPKQDGFKGVIAKTTGDAARNNYGYIVFIQATSGVAFYTADAAGSWGTNNASMTLTTTFSHSTSTWYKYDFVVVQGTTVGNKIYRDGADTSASVSGYLPTSSMDNGDSFTLGNESDSGYDFYGNLDEVRIRMGALSSTWLSTEYNNQNAPSTFYTASAPASGSGPASLKTRDTIAKASVKTINGIAIASVKTVDTIA